MNWSRESEAIRPGRFLKESSPNRPWANGGGRGTRDEHRHHQGDDNYEDDFEYFGEENLFSRDVVDDQLIRFEKATAKQFKEMVPIVLDGVSFQVPKAVPLADAQGNHINDEEGNPIPRMTTIFDAMNSYCREYNKRKEEEAFSQSMATGVGPGRSTGFGRSGKVDPNELLTNPIPVLCHQEHMQPVGVCRMCLVQIEQTKKGRASVQLVPACTRRVEAGMTIHTPRTPNPKVAADLKAKTGVLAELLTADHGEYRDGVRDTGDAHTELDELTRKLWGTNLRASPPIPRRAGATTRRRSSRSTTARASCATAASGPVRRSSKTSSLAAAARGTCRRSASTSTRPWGTPAACRAASAWSRARRRRSRSATGPQHRAGQEGD